MSDIRIKYSDNDKCDMYMPNKTSWLNNASFEASKYIDSFHCNRMRTYIIHKRRDSTSNVSGVQKEMWRASHRGIYIDSTSIGKSSL